MLRERVENLKQEYTGQYVVVDSDRPDLARFNGRTGQVKTINMGGRALVEFQGKKDRGWYDIELDFLKVVDRPEPKQVKTKQNKPPATKTPANPADAPSVPDSPQELSPLELARMEKAARDTGSQSADSKLP